MNQTTAPNYKWVVLSNTTLGVLIATINSSILLIALPDIFRGLNIDPLAPGNSSYLLWLIMGYLVVTAVLVVSFGRLGDMYGRVRMYNAGFAIFTIFSVLLAATWMTGTPGVLWLIVMRVLQGVGGALLMGNSNAIITDAFPVDQRGLALGLNMVAAIAGSFLGLVIGGSWRRSTGAWSSSCPYRSASSGRGGPTSSSTTTGCVTTATSTGGATSPSGSVSSRSWSLSRTGSSRMPATSWGGPTRGLSLIH